MSIDLELYTARRLTVDDLRRAVPSGDAWREYDGDVLAHEATSWQVVVGCAEDIDPADVASDLKKLLPELRYRVSLTLEPIGAPVEGRAFLADVVEALGRSFDCVGYDLETGAPRRYSSTAQPLSTPPRRRSKDGETPTERPNREQVEADLADYLRVEAERLPDLLRRAGLDRVPVDFRIETLVGLLDWLSRQVTTVQEPVPAGAAPEMGASLERAWRRLDDPSRTLVRTASFYVGETFRAAFPHLRWAVGTEGFSDEGVPVITGFAHGLELGVENVTTNIALAVAVDGERDRASTAVETWKRYALAAGAQ